MGKAIGSILGAPKIKAPDFTNQRKAAREANELQQQIYDESVARGTPFLEPGQAAASRLGLALGLTGDPQAEGYGTLADVDMANFTADPSYQFRLGEGQKALERSAAARGSLYSPATSKALMDYAQNLASQEYGNIYDRRAAQQSNLFNRLANVSGTGQTQANLQTAAGQNLANIVGATNLGLEQAQTAANLATQAAKQSQFAALLGAAGNVAGAGISNKG